VAGRPLYHEFAWAYDQLVARPGGVRADGVASALERRGVEPGARVVDAGCGTGAYTIALDRAGFHTTGIDASREMVAEAGAKAARERSGASFVVADLREWPSPEPFAGALCRGVLNDFVTDADRIAALGGLRRMLRPGGVLVADVREWDESVAHYSEEPVLEHAVDTPQGPIAFRSETRLEPRSHMLRVTQRLEHRGHAEKFELAMRCWTHDELARELTAAGFDDVELPAPDDDLTPRRRDRIVAVARAA
jgi:SAM-dependent methyltransferase